ncbi:hypothetical protein MMC08_007975 [Hypocenomyce scalaris]|nr:hypothetical protein [Hypocenomyce scalaris]
MDIYACGFNAHNQLNFDSLHKRSDDIDQFERICRGRNVRLLCALWSSTALEVNGELVLRGSQHTSTNRGLIQGLGAGDISRLYGDHTGVLGAVAKDGSIWTLTDNHHSLSLVKERHHHKAQAFVEAIAIAGNGKVCICRRTNPDPETGDKAPRLGGSTLQAFPCLSNLLSYNEPEATYDLPITITQLSANSTSFTALAANGEVYTWGDPRHSHLGRTPTATSSAHMPCPVTFLGGIPIRKIASGGWITAAVSRDDDLYIWGGRPGESERIGALPTVGKEVGKEDNGEEVKLVNIDGGTDIVDVAIGGGHIVVLTGEGKVFAVGSGQNGQLGGEKRAFAEDWVEAEPLRGKKVVGVECGYWASFALVRANDAS